MPAYDAVTKIWLDYYSELTGRTGRPEYDKNGNLFGWIAQFKPNYQTEILQRCYEAGCLAGGGGDAMTDQTIKADAGKPRLSLVPYQICNDIAMVREFGNKKYSDPESWRRVEPARYIDALLRHVHAFAENPLGVDEESGIEHYKHAACNLAFLCEMLKDEESELPGQISFEEWGQCR